MIGTVKKHLLLLKWEIEARIPEPVKYWREFVTLPYRKWRDRYKGFVPEMWDRGVFLCLCDEHLEDFSQEGDLEAPDTIGYYVCDAYGCGRTATYELFPNLETELEEFVEELKEDE